MRRCGWEQTRRSWLNWFDGLLRALVLMPYIYRIFFDTYHNMSGTVVHLLEWPTLALCSNPGHQTKGHHVPLGWCDCKGSSPALGSLPAACFRLFFLWSWLV